MADGHFQLHGIDLAVIGIYLAVMVGIGLGLSGKSHSAKDYFLAGRSMTWPVIGFSLFASNISSTTLVGLAGDAYATGISVFNYEWMAVFILVFYAVFILPQVLRSQVFTMPEYLQKRFDGRIRTYFAALTLFLNIVVDTAATLYAGGLILQLIFPAIPMWQMIAALALVAGLYTVLGGLSAVMITDVIQAVLLIIGSVTITAFAFFKVGGWAAISQQVDAAHLSLIRPVGDAGVPWLGLITGVPLLGFYFWCTNQFMVQRILSAKSIDQGRWGALFAGFLKLPVLFIMVLPGTMAILLYPDLPRADLVYPTLMFDLLPVGMLGLVIAGFLAALMSQIDSTLNSASTLVTMDFIRRWRPNLTSAQLMQYGRITTVIFMIVAVAWAPQIANFKSLFKYLQTILSYAVPPVVVMFLLGTFWARANAHGAFLSLVVGVAAGVVFFLANEVFGLTHIHFLYVAPILSVLCAVVLVIGSLTSAPPPPEKVTPFVWTRRAYDAETAALKTRKWYANYRILSLLLMALTAALVFAFR